MPGLNITYFEFYVAIFLSIFNAVLLIKASYKFFQIFQVSNYHIGSFFNWVFNSKQKFLSRIFMLSFLSTSCLFVTNTIFYNFKDVRLLSYLGLLFYFYFTSVFVNNTYSSPQKKKLTYTKRMVRLMTLCFLIFFVFTFLFMLISYKYTNIFTFTIIALTPLLIPVIIPLCNIIMYPFEMLVQNHYLKLATKKLQSRPDLIRIGITGSYAKTSTKDILKTILKEKYNVCFTPNSYNTPMGIAKTINKRLTDEDQIFICEMGATYKMDIAKLVKIVDPSITVLTGVANQHLATFKSLENVIETKYEIVKYSKPGTICVFNGNNSITYDLYNRTINDKQKILIKNDDENSFCRAENIVYTPEYSTFDLVLENSRYHVKTNLHGSFSVENLLMAVAVSSSLGLSPEQIISGIEKCEQSEHRLFVKKLDNDITVIDDSFNANEYGTQRAIEYLSLYKDKRKIVMTPGLVDLGKREKEINYLFGKKISAVADLCIIVNLNAREELVKGLKDGGFDESNIILCDTLHDAQKKMPEILSAGDVILMCNDLPDNYI